MTKMLSVVFVAALIGGCAQEPRLVGYWSCPPGIHVGVGKSRAILVVWNLMGSSAEYEAYYTPRDKGFDALFKRDLMPIVATTDDADAFSVALDVYFSGPNAMRVIEPLKGEDYSCSRITRAQFLAARVTTS